MWRNGSGANGRPRPRICSRSPRNEVTGDRHAGLAVSLEHRMRFDSSFCLLGLAGAMALAPAGCSKRAAAESGKETAAPASARAARAVTVATVADQVMERSVAVIGSLAAHDEATLSVKVPGRLQTLAVDLGSSVRQGELIAQVESKDYELQLTQAEAFLSQARARLGLTLSGDDEKVDATQTSTV